MGSAECLGHGSRGSWFSLSLIVLVLLVGGKKRDNFYEDVLPMFSGRQSNRFLSVDPFQSAAHPLGLAAWHAFTTSCRPSLVSSKASPHLFEFPRDEHSGTASQLMPEYLPFSIYLFLFPRAIFFAWIVFAVSGNELMPKTIVHHVLYCLDRVAAVLCLFCPLKWGCLSLTFHRWGKYLQLLCWYILSFMLEKFFRFCSGWVMSNV